MILNDKLQDRTANPARCGFPMMMGGKLVDPLARNP
jgi:hypothetical protein